MTAHGSSKSHHATQNRAKQDLGAGCLSVAGQDRILSAFMMDLTCFLISPRAVSSRAYPQKPAETGNAVDSLLFTDSPGTAQFSVLCLHLIVPALRSGT